MRLGKARLSSVSHSHMLGLGRGKSGLQAQRAQKLAKLFMLFLFKQPRSQIDLSFTYHTLERVR